MPTDLDTGMSRALCKAYSKREILMSHQNRLHVFSALLVIIVFVFNIRSGMVSAAPSEPSTPGATGTSTLSRLPALTPTLGSQVETESEAWVDGSIDTEQFGPMEALIIHFNTPMSPVSSPHPVLSWPNVEGVSSWDHAQTTLTFKPGSALDSKKTYTFFLDTALQSMDGKTLKNPSEWIVRVQRGPKVQSVSPEPGSLERRFRLVEVHFDRHMKRDISNGLLVIAPAVGFELKWKSPQILQIALQQPLQPGQRYDLTLKGGDNENALFGADGTYLAEDYRWFYWQEPFDVQVDILGERSFAVKFNYLLDKNKSGLPFAMTPPLEGEWEWFSTQEIRFIAKDIIPASNEFTLSLTQPLIDSNGFEISTIPALSFSGLSPVRLTNRNIRKNDYDDTLIA